MHSSVENLCKALEDLSSAVLPMISDDRTMTEIYGWNFPTLTRHDIAGLPKIIASKINQADINVTTKELLSLINNSTKKVQLLKTNVLPQCFNGNGAAAIPNLIDSLRSIEDNLFEFMGWTKISDNKLMPAPLARRLRSLNVQIDSIAFDKENLEKQIKLIEQATSAAESLPTDLDELQQARKVIDKISIDAATSFGKVESKSAEVVVLLEEISQKHGEAKKLVDQCEEAYRITTTKGLAAAFDQRAKNLSVSMWIWVGGLLVSLVIAALIGAHRIELLSEAVAAENPLWSIIWMHLGLSLLSVTAPLWFAWLATKQIGHRFKLSEDYGYKASVAKAYEGYRKEAARLDPEFEGRLFASTLTRLEEAPIRLFDIKEHGSPWNELLNTPQFQKATELVPELKDAIISLIKKSD